MAKDHAFKFDDGAAVTVRITGKVVKRSTEASGDSYLVEYSIGAGRTAAKWIKEADLAPVRLEPATEGQGELGTIGWQGGVDA
jgi:hypothetical protein